jgi:hypothetical protein
LSFSINVHASDIKGSKAQEKDGCAQQYLSDKGQVTGLESNNEVTTSLEG